MAIIRSPERISPTPLDKGGSYESSNVTVSPLNKGGLRGDRPNLITTGYHLPYNPNLIPIAKILRRHMTEPEKKLWHDYLRNFHYRVLRQRPIDRYIVDFYCPRMKLVIEIDGDTHFTNEGKQRDKERSAILEGYGLRVIRFLNTDIMNNFEAVCNDIEAIAELR